MPTISSTVTKVRLAKNHKCVNNSIYLCYHQGRARCKSHMAVDLEVALFQRSEFGYPYNSTVYTQCHDKLTITLLNTAVVATADSKYLQI